jgi:hypothetical protein
MVVKAWSASGQSLAVQKSDGAGRGGGVDPHVDDPERHALGLKVLDD